MPLDTARLKKISKVILSLFTVSLLSAVLPPGEAHGAAGDVVWQDVFNLGGGGNEARTVAVAGDRVFVGGFGNQNNDQSAWILRAYQAETGQLLWDDVLNLGGGNSAVFGVAAEGNRVFAAGGGNDASDNSLWIVRAYDANGGGLIWEDLFGNDGRFAEARAVSADSRRVYAGGRAEDVSGGSEWLVRAYDSSTGDLLWQDRFGIDGKDEGVRSIALLGDRLYVSGGGPNPLTTGDWLVRAYDAETGEVLWEDRLGVPDGLFLSLSVTVRDGRVFASGIGQTLTESDWIVRAYDANSGGVLWEDRFDTGFGTGATGITANRFGVFATGGIASETQGNAMIVKSYNPENGDTRWEDRVDFDARGGSGGTSISSHGDRVYAVGSGSIDSIDLWILRSYDGGSGGLLWEDLFNLGGGTNVPFATVARKKRVYAVGSALASMGSGLEDVWIARAYEADGGGGGGCSVSAVMPERSVPLYLLLPALVLVLRLRARLSFSRIVARKLRVGLIPRE